MTKAAEQTAKHRDNREPGKCKTCTHKDAATAKGYCKDCVKSGTERRKRSRLRKAAEEIAKMQTAA